MTAISFLTAMLTVGPTGILTIPASTDTIADFAFMGSERLVAVECEPGARLVAIGEGAFADCPNLERVELPGSLRSLGDGCFMMCPSLRSLELPEGVERVPRYMCAWDGALERVTLPGSLRDIGSHAFSYCSSLEALEIPDGTEHIGSNVLSLCTSVVEVTFPDSVTEFESYVLSGCTSLRRVRLPGNPSLLGEQLFSDCTALEEITVSSAVPPPFDCGMPPFGAERGRYDDCRLRVPAGSAEAYVGADGWNLFREILSIE